MCVLESSQNTHTFCWSLFWCLNATDRQLSEAKVRTMLWWLRYCSAEQSFKSCLNHPCWKKIQNTNVVFCLFRHFVFVSFRLLLHPPKQTPSFHSHRHNPFITSRSDQIDTRISEMFNWLKLQRCDISPLESDRGVKKTNMQNRERKQMVMDAGLTSSSHRKDKHFSQLHRHTCICAVRNLFMNICCRCRKNVKHDKTQHKKWKV